VIQEQRKWGLLALVFLSACVLVWKLISVENTPPKPDGATMVAVTLPSLSGEAKKGQIRFQEKCAVCHGKKADGKEGLGPPLVHKIYEPSHHGDGAFHLAALSGVRAHHWPFGDMPPIENVAEQDVAQIVVFVRALQRANGIN
jgi:cytochrome c